MSAEDAKKFFDKLQGSGNDPLKAAVKKSLEDIAKAAGNPASDKELTDELAARWQVDAHYIKFPYSEPPGF